MLALLVAGVLVPASADAVLSLEDASGVRALLERAATHAASLGPQPVGATLRDRVGVDLLAETGEWGLSPKGPRQLVFARDGMGLIAPVRDAASAKRALSAWVNQKPRRMGRVAGGRLLTASGNDPAALLGAMSRPAALPAALAVRARGPVWLWVRLAAPLRALTMSIDAGATGIAGHGLVTADGPLLAGPAPPGCESGLACVRAAVAPTGRRVLAATLAQLGYGAQPELASAVRVEERVEPGDPAGLSDGHSLPHATRLLPVFDAAPATGPALELTVALDAIDGELVRLTPLDALRGPLAATAYAAHLLYGALLRSAGPLALTGNPRGDGADLELRLPLR